MSDLAAYSFLPWLRQGLAGQITRVDGSGGPAPRAEVPVELRTSAGNAGVGLALQGPGEVTGIDGRAVARTWPVAGANSAEPNYFPLIELTQPDLPWRYTPARANGERLRPWLCLVVLDADVVVQPPDSRRPLPRVNVAPDDLPRLDQSWAWAHGQLSGTEPATPGGLGAVLTSQPNRLVSRLLSPRRLDPNTSYRAVVVPTFERGRLAGLGEAVPDAVDALAPAWTPGGPALDLPVYYQWEFRTGAHGDFEYLVRLLQARVLPTDTGRRAMAVNDPGAGLPSAATTLGIEGALRSTAMQPTPWPDSGRLPFVQALARLVSRPAGVVGATEPRRVVPPLYGGRVVRRDVLEPGARPRWFHQLNADPRTRGAAGLGTSVVQANQRALMASAWLQVDGIRKANETLRHARLGHVLSTQVFARHVATGDLDSMLHVTAPLHARVKASPTTVRSVLGRSPLPSGVLGASFRKVARPAGPVARRAVRPLARGGLLRRLNAGELQAATVPRTPPTLATPEQLAGGRTSGTAAAPGCLARLPRRPLLVGAAVALLASRLLGRGTWLGRLAASLGAALALAAGATTRRGVLGRLLGDAERRAHWADGTLGPNDAADAPPRPDFALEETPPGDPGEPVRPRPPTLRERLGLARDSADAAAFRRVLVDHLREEATAPAAGEVLEEARLDDLRATLESALEPGRTIADAIRARRVLPSDLVGTVILEADDPIEPVMAAPEFPQPMYEPLRDLSQDWLLPGLEKVQPNTVSLLATNQRFIEAYMAGLNHAMAEELLWHEYPTDQRGSYFRQFWDVKGYVPRPGETVDPETLKDIKRLHEWRSRADLGENTARRPPPGGDHLVLLVRGELLRRYPNTMVYATKAVLGADGLRTLDDTTERHPVFRATLRPDLTFFGFELTDAEVRGNTDPTRDQGWFFVLQEIPGEPRFGLDVGSNGYGAEVTSWNDLAWSSLAADAAGLDAIRYVDLAAALPDTAVAGPERWHVSEGATAAHLASITLQRPMRVAMHASDMLP